MMIMLSEDFNDYVNCDPTKCLNTGILISSLFLGTDVSKSFVTQCDNEVVKRQDRLTSLHHIKKLERYLQSHQNGVFYVIMSDGVFDKKNTFDATQYFPGHIFVIEKHSAKSFTVIQSFVGEYDISSIRGCKSFKSMKFLIKMLNDLYVENRWTQKTTKDFMRLTDVDGSKFEGYDIDISQFKFCAVCVESISHAVDYLVTVVNQWLETVKSKSGKAIWNCHSTYSMDRDTLMNRLQTMYNGLINLANAAEKPRQKTQHPFWHEEQSKVQINPIN